MLNNALAGRNRSASDVSRFRLSSVQLRNHKVGYFDPLLWAVRVMICVATFCIGGKCSVVLCLKNRKYGGVSSLSDVTIRYVTLRCVRLCYVISCGVSCTDCTERITCFPVFTKQP